MTDNGYGTLAPLTKRQQRALHKKMKAGDRQARDRMIRSNLRLVLWCVANSRSQLESDMTTADLVQQGIVALVRCVDKWDPDQAEFSSYATACIRRELKREIRHGQGVSFPQHEWEERNRLMGCARAMAGDGDVLATSDEVAARFELDPARTRKLLTRIDTVELEPYMSGSDHGEWVDELVTAVTVADKLKCLDPDERTVITGRFLETKQLQTVGKEMGLSRIEVRKIERNALRKMAA